MLNVQLLMIMLAVGTGAQNPTVTTEGGMLIGTSEKIQEYAIDRYLGVPYAKPPTGFWRFRGPEAVEKSSKLIDTTDFKPSCVQPNHMLKALNPVIRAEELKSRQTSEDCLFLNVYVPKLTSRASNLPVIVWIPGEGFDYAKANQFDGTDLAFTSKSIVITVNYRVSVLGFLTTGDHHSPGNMGLLDQQMALKWTQKNIAAFGGDASKVTLMGRFTGSMSIAMHFTSPSNTNQRYFSRVVMQSGIPDGPYVFGNNPENGTMELAEAVGCRSTSILAETMECLRKVDADQLLSKALELSQTWAPVIDGHYLIEEPLNAVKHGRYDHKVRVILGMNSDEGSMCLLTHEMLATKYYKKLLSDDLNSEDVADMMKANLEDFYKKPINGVRDLVKFEYSKRSAGERKLSKRKQYMGFCGDMYFKASIVNMADELSKHSTKVWLYEFNHRPSSSIYPHFVSAAHGDDVLFSLGLINKGEQVTFEETNLSYLMMKSLGNFADSGSPGQINSISWPFYDHHRRQQYFQWTSKITDESVKNRLKSTQRFDFWTKVLPKLI